MKIGIDSYTFHRYFGEWYAGLQEDVGERWTVSTFLDHAARLNVQGVSLESCFLPEDASSVAQLRDALQARQLEVVWAWGHPNGLGSGSDAAAAAHCAQHIQIAQRLGAPVMRICAGGRRTRPDSWDEHKSGLLRLLRPLVDEAARRGVVLAIENHIDLLAEEMVELIEAVDSPWLGVCLDTANNLRMQEDPVEVARRLAPYTRATHVKDVKADRGDPATFAYWPSVPLGLGQVDLHAILRVLREANYQGLLALEIDYLAPAYVAAGEMDAVSKSLRWLEGQLAQLQPTHPAQRQGMQER